MSDCVATDTWAEIEAIAFRKEKVAARRLAIRTGVSVADALHQLLTAAALPGSIIALVAHRRHAHAQQDHRRRLHQQQKTDAWQARQAARQPPVSHWQGWFDGSAFPNPGRIGIGAVLRSPTGELTEISRNGGQGDSNQAEYQALIALLAAAFHQQVPELTIYGDSRIVIEDMTGVHLVPVLTDYRRQALYLCTKIHALKFRWIPRAKNRRADSLAQSARSHSNKANASICLGPA